MARDAAVEAAMEALMDAADEDTATGGFDLSREIYPTCKLMTKSGVEDVEPEELLRARENVLSRRAS